MGFHAFVLTILSGVHWFLFNLQFWCGNGLGRAVRGRRCIGRRLTILPRGITRKKSEVPGMRWVYIIKHRLDFLSVLGIEIKKFLPLTLH